MELRRGNDAEIWYHGSNKTFALLREGSTVTRNGPLAEAFSHKPPLLSCGEDGVLLHYGRKKGYLYVVDEPVCAEEDLLPHPRTTLLPGAEFLTQRPLRVRLIAELGKPGRSARGEAKRRLKERVKNRG